MAFWNQFTARFGAQPDLLGFAATATPSADAWLGAFTDRFMQHPDTVAGTQAFMSGLRFYTADFMTQLAALPPVATRRPPIMGNIPCAIYTATGPIILDVYERLIRQHADRRTIEAAFTQALPALIQQYNATTYTANGVGY
jgi:hypothetical protein